MNDLFPSQEPDMQKPAGLQFFNGVFCFISQLFHLTREEAKDAGIYLGSQYDNFADHVVDKENIQ